MIKKLAPPRHKQIHPTQSAHGMSHMKYLRPFLIAFTLVSTASAESARQPNILFLFADDLAYDAVGFSGNDEVRTPVLDKLAASGTVFENAYNSGAWHGAVCVASRTMLITGSQLWTAEKNEKSLEPRYADTNQTWPQRMKALGYHTVFTGKWHVQIKPETIHDKVVDILPGMPNHKIESQYQRLKADGSDTWDASAQDGSGFWQDGKHWTVRTTDHAIELLERQKDSDAPFFLSVSFSAPHDPRQSPAGVLNSYDKNHISVPANFVPEYPIDPEHLGLGKGWTLRDELLAPVPRTPDMVKTHRREYFAAITYLDQHIARIIDALERTGKADNTIIVFTSDHGLACGQHGLLGKQNMYEHSLRVPFLISGPGIPGGQRRQQLIYLQDAMPTTLQLAGAGDEQLAGIDFTSILPAIADNAHPGRQTLYAAYEEKQRAIRDKDWKLLLYPLAKSYRVYHLAKDPLEVNDLAGTAEGEAQSRRLFALLRTAQSQLKDELELAPVFPNLAE